MRQMEDSCVIIPTYNERDNIVRLIEDIFRYLPGIHIYVVDDSSPDGTAGVVDTLSKQYGSVHLIRHPVKSGLSTAYKEVFPLVLRKGYRFIVQMDGDHSHHPRYIPQMLERAEQGEDMVIGSRYKKGLRTRDWSILRLLFSYTANWFARFMLRTSVRDVTSGFRCFRAAALQRINLSEIRSKGFAFQIEMVGIFQRNGLRIEELPITFFGRKRAKSKLSLRMVFEALLTVIRFGLRLTG